MDERYNKDKTDTARRSSPPPLVYVTEGRIGAELRASVKIDAGELIMTESAYCFARHDDSDDGDNDASLPSIVQAALDALQKDREDAKADINPSTGKANTRTISKTQTIRKWKDLVATEDQSTNHEESSEDPQRQQKEASFEWGAQQIMHRLAVSSPKSKITSITKQDALEAIQRVSLNAFSVKLISTMNNDDSKSCWTANTITSDEDLQQAIMSIGTNNSSHESVTIGDAIFLLASAANHSCRPNAHVTFHPQQAPAAVSSSSNNAIASEDITISIRAISNISKHEEMTISYGPLVGVDGTVRDRREAIRASGTQSFQCRCSACLEEEKRQPDGDIRDMDAAAMLFIETYITGGQTTAEKALMASQKFLQGGAASSRHFGKAMSDTSLQTIPYDVNMAVEFQKLALQSLEQRYHPSIAGMSATTTKQQPREDDPLAVAYELMKLSLLQLFSEEEEEESDGDNTKCNDKDKMIQSAVIRARRILCRYYGEDGYPYRQLLDSIHC